MSSEEPGAPRPNDRLSADLTMARRIIGKAHNQKASSGPWALTSPQRKQALDYTKIMHEDRAVDHRRGVVQDHLQHVANRDITDARAAKLMAQLVINSLKKRKKRMRRDLDSRKPSSYSTALPIMAALGVFLDLALPPLDSLRLQIPRALAMASISQGIHLLLAPTQPGATLPPAASGTAAERALTGVQ